MSELASDLAKSLAEPGRVVTCVDYNKWLAEIGPEAVQELLDIRETRTVDVGDGVSFEIPVNGLLTGWQRHCDSQGWVNTAFEQERKAARAKLLQSIEREEEAGT